MVDEPGLTRMPSPATWRALLAVWVIALIVLPDPRPLGAPPWAVSFVQSLTGTGQAGARTVATLALRVFGIGALGALVMLATGASRWGRRSAAALIAAPLLATAVLWLNYGYFPIALQLQIGAASAAAGALAGLALRCNPIAALGLVTIVAGVFTWGTATGIDDELDRATRVVGRHLLASADRIPDGDDGFVALLELAFAFAAESSRGNDPVEPNRAAILALGVILGHESLADVAGREIDRGRLPQAEALRDRLTAHGRKDWPRHFWVSAALTLLSDEDRSITVGLTKELLDSIPDGSGFSFPDLAVDAAGNRFALAATRDADAARAMQALVLGGVQVADLVPDVRTLPEGIAQEDLHEVYGGLGGDETSRIVADIRRRLEGCRALR